MKRFRLQWSNPDGGTATLVEHPEGEFVAFADASALMGKLSENLDAWDDEEESVQEEHMDLIEETRALVEKLSA